MAFCWTFSPVFVNAWLSFVVFHYCSKFIQLRRIENYFFPLLPLVRHFQTTRGVWLSSVNFPSVCKRASAGLRRPGDPPRALAVFWTYTGHFVLPPRLCHFPLSLLNLLQSRRAQDYESVTGVCCRFRSLCGRRFLRGAP